ncbi:MAG: PAS domain S-box protein [Blastocatellia bacterium]
MELKNNKPVGSLPQQILSQTLDLVTDGIVVINEKQEISIFNHSAREIFGYSEDEILGKSVKLLIPSRFYDVYNSYIEQVSNQQNFSNTKQKILGLHKNGNEFLIEMAISRSFSEGQLFFIATIRDISELKIVNKLLQQQTKILTSISESMTIFLQEHDVKKAVYPILETVSNETKSQFTGLGFFIDNAKLEIITNVKQVINAEITNLMCEEIENKKTSFENISLHNQLAYLAKKTLLTSSNQIENLANDNLAVKKFKLRKFLSIPIKCQKQTTSVLILANDTFAYNEKIIQLLEPAVEALGIIVDSYQHIQQKTKLENQQKITQKELLTRAHQQSVLVRLGRQALLESDISKLMEYFVNSIKEILNIDCCFILEFDEDNTLFLRPESFGLIQNTLNFNPNSPSFVNVNSNSLVNILLGSTGPLIIDDLETDLRISTPEFFNAQKFTSGVSVVLYLDNEVFGFLGAFTRSKRFFTSNEANFLQTIAHTLVTAIKRKQDEDRLGEHLKLIDASHEAIIACDLKQRVIFWSRGAANLYAVEREKAIGTKISNLIASQQFNLINNIIETILKSNEWVGEIASQDSKGNDMVVLSHWSLVCDNVGKPKSFLLVNTNITEKKKLEAQFLRTQRMENLGSLASGIAHDLNNLLTPITLSLDLLKRRADERSLRLIERVETSTKRGSEMVRQILSFAKGIESSQTTIDLQHVFEELLNMLKVSFPQNIRIFTDYSPKIWLVLANATQIFQVLMNLCVNARDAMTEGGVLSIKVKNIILEDLEEFKELEHAAAFVQISVSDTGMGMSSEQVKKIFEPFFTTKGAKGTGLGLAMVASIVEKHKGIIRVNSELNKGTTFSIYLPAINDEEIKESLSGKKESLVGNNQTVLLVDSEISTLEISKTALEAYNYKILSTNNGAEAIAIYFEKQQNIDVIIVDMLTAEVEGAIVISSLKKANPKVKIIATSNDLNAYSKLGSLSALVKKVTKPYTAETLLKSLKEMLSK